MKQITLIGFILMCLAQLYVPAKMIFQNENIITKGELFKFKTEPVDPNDPFRGKYIRLNFEASQFKVIDTTQSYRAANTVYVLLENNSQGFAQIKDLRLEAPATDQAYLKVSQLYFSSFRDTTTIQIEYPFDRFYLEESKAPDAERLYFEALRDSNLTTYARVYIYQGQATLEDVLINEMPISEWVEINRDKE